MVRGAVERGCADRGNLTAYDVRRIGRVNQILFDVGCLAQFEQYAAGGSRMEEGDAMSAGTGPNPGREGFEPCSFGFRDCRVEIGYPQADMVDARSSLCQVPRDWRVGAGGLEQFNAPGAFAKERDADLFGWNFLLAGDVLSKKGRPDGDGFGQGFDRDSNVVDLVQANSLLERISADRAFGSTPESESNLGVLHVKIQHEIGE